MTAIKKNHHYVPQFWLRSFADSTGKIKAWDGQKVRNVSTKRIMQEDWLYTLFDNAWDSSDALEDALAKMEGEVSPLYKKLCDSSEMSFTSSERNELCDFLALQACRHPDILRRGHRLAKKLGELLAGVHNFQTVNDFILQALEFGIPQNTASAFYVELMKKTPEQLRQEFDELNTLSPQSAQLPIQEALRAQTEISKELSKMKFTLLDAPAGQYFILGDTPLPQSEAHRGFTVPLSKSVAVEALPASSAQAVIPRRQASTKEVIAINQTQWDNSLHIVIGPDSTAFQTL